ncbi:MAG: penicillin-binding protein [Ignavibacteriales bacterium]|nr:penicillin-binding protein [Ignavibacteriales bacterium]
MNKGRALLIVFLLIGFWSVLLIRLFTIQIKEHDDLIFYANRQQIKEKNLRAERGFIYDRNADLLAYDRNDISIYVDCNRIDSSSIRKITENFSRVFNKSTSHYKSLLIPGCGEICIERKVAREKSIQLKDLVLDCLEMREDPTRVYSYDNLASHLLGYVGTEKYNGVEGIEKFYNKNLNGKDGKMIVLRDVWGRMISVAEEATILPEPGNSLILTIDKTYQNILEEELQKGIDLYKSRSAVGIIMNPNNGEILAMADMPDFNPNTYWDYSNEVRRNRILTDTYEPGSTFKAITVSTLIDKNLCKSSDMVFCENGDYQFKKVHIKDTHKYGMLSVKQVIELSSNIGMAKLISRINNDDLYKYLRDFGFGNYTSIDLPGESKGRLKKPGFSRFDDYTKPFMSFGYEISVTPIQIITAYATLINGGYLYQPHLVKEIKKRSNETVEQYEPKQLRKVINSETSETIREFLAGVVENGTAKNSKSSKVTFGGKTGTSQKLSGKEYTTEYNSSFIGFFPIDKPEIVCMILYNSPQIGKYGGLVAAPVFKNIVERLAAFDINLISKPPVEKQKTANIEQILASNEKHESGVKYSDVSEPRIANTELHKINIKNKNIMPDLHNNNLRDALSILNQIGLNYKINGNGKVVSQSISPGTTVKPGQVCSLNCEAKKIARININ